MLSMLTYAPRPIPARPKRKIRMFFHSFQLYLPRLSQLVAVSMMAGAIRDRVDIFTDPSRETKRSSHGTVAARATASFYRNSVA